MDAPRDFTAFLEAQRALYRRDLPDRVARLAALVADGSDLDTAEREAHSIAGSAGTFGLDDVGRLARRIELAVHDARAHGHALRGDIAVDLAELEKHAASS